MVISSCTWRHGKLSVDLITIAGVQKLIASFDRADLCQPQLLDHAILIRAVVTLHSAFSLGRMCRDDFNSQLFASTPKLRQHLESTLSRYLPRSEEHTSEL